MKKKLLAMTCATVLCVAMVGCGNKEASTITPNTVTTPANSATTAATSATVATVADSTTAAGNTTTTAAGNTTATTAAATTNGTALKVGNAAFDVIPLMNKFTFPTTLDAVKAEWGEPNVESSFYTWQFDEGKISLYEDSSNPGTIIGMSFDPAVFSSWYDANNDYSKIDTNKTYTYTELAGVIGTSGTVSNIIRNATGKYTYRITWWNADAKMCYAEFDYNTDTTTYLSVSK